MSAVAAGLPGRLNAHPAADLFPLLEGGAFAALVEDIRANGQQQPILIYEDQILDGRNRWRACEAIGIAPKLEIYAGDEPVRLGTRGKPFWPPAVPANVIKALRREHSRKPDEFYAMVEELCPGRRLDFFSRQRREGWAQYGDQADAFEEVRS